MYNGQISGIKGSGVSNLGTFHMYGGEICHNVSKHIVGGVGNDGVFYMYGGKIFANTAEWFYGGVDNTDTFHMYGGEISGNIGGYGGVSFSEKDSGTLELTTMLVGGSAVISGNKDWNGVEKNVYIGSNVISQGGRIIIDSDNPLSDGARIGITIQSRPTIESPIQLTGMIDQDYSSFFFSDDEKYEVIDSPNHAVLLGVKHEHTQDEETWNYDADNHWKECSKCGKKFEEAAHAFDDWVTDSEATDTEDGEKHRDCSVCNFQETEVIPAARPTAPRHHRLPLFRRQRRRPRRSLRQRRWPRPN